MAHRVTRTAGPPGDVGRGGDANSSAARLSPSGSLWKRIRGVGVSCHISFVGGAVSAPAPAPANRGGGLILRRSSCHDVRQGHCEIAWRLAAPPSMPAPLKPTLAAAQRAGRRFESRSKREWGPVNGPSVSEHQELGRKEGAGERTPGSHGAGRANGAGERVAVLIDASYRHGGRNPCCRIPTGVLGRESPASGHLCSSDATLPGPLPFWVFSCAAAGTSLANEHRMAALRAARNLEASPGEGGGGGSRSSRGADDPGIRDIIEGTACPAWAGTFARGFSCSVVSPRSFVFRPVFRGSPRGLVGCVLRQLHSKVARNASRVLPSHHTLSFEAPTRRSVRHEVPQVDAHDITVAFLPPPVSLWISTLVFPEARRQHPRILRTSDQGSRSARVGGSPGDQAPGVMESPRYGGSPSTRSGRGCSNLV